MYVSGIYSGREEKCGGGSCVCVCVCVFGWAGRAYICYIVYIRYICYVELC